MSQKHPLDDTFRRKLRQYEAHAPDALWQKIDAERTWQAKLHNRFRFYKGGLALVATVVLAVGLLVLNQDKPTVELGFFPIDPEASTTQKAIAAVDAPIATPSAPSLVEEKNIIQSNTSIESKLTLQPGTNASANSQIDTPTATEIPVLEAAAESSETMPATPGVSSQEENIAVVAQPRTTSFASFAALPANAYTPLETGAFATELKCVSFKTGKRHWYGELSTGVTTSLRDLQAREAEYIPYADGRAETEFTQLSFNTEARLSIVSPSGVAFRTGLNYTQLNERLDYANENERHLEITEVQGDDGEIISIDTIIVVGLREVKTQNRYRMLDVPLILGYELTHDKMTFAFNAGMYLNLTYRQRGDFISPIDQEPVSFSSNSQDAYPAYKSQIGLGWYGSIGMYYKMNARTQVYLEPSLRMYTQSSTIEEYPLKQNYVLGSLNVGLRRVIF